ncbi:SH3 domain-containing protein [Defluviimonas sp. SAOS-178_SWC]|uniref:SH3 domain-containing protein n=1 Tax=Defluviimonas sp. SAOS-178_SWC TaxID=3121287 RepID=UPI003221A05A
MRPLLSVAACLALATALAAPDSAQAGGAATALGAMTAPQIPAVAAGSDPDMFATGVQSGPDFWQVTGVASNDTLNIRSGPGTGNRVVARAPNGAVLRNLGCQGSGSARWCKVETKDGTIRGWVSGKFLRESGGSSSGAAADVPELAVRTSGEIEVRWSSGCTMLYNSRGDRLSTGGSCSRSQRDRSDDAVTRYMREQGGSAAEGGGAPMKMNGLGRVTQGGLVTGKITSKNGRSYALILTATQDGLTCTGSFDEAPGVGGASSTIIHCTNGSSGSAIMNGKTLTFTAGGKGGYVKF